MFMASARNFKRIFFDIQVYNSSSKERTPFNLSFHILKIKCNPHLEQNIVYKWSCPEETCNLSYIGESNTCFQNRVKEHSNHVTSAIYQHSISQQPGLSQQLPSQDTRLRWKISCQKKLEKPSIFE